MHRGPRTAPGPGRRGVRCPTRPYSARSGAVPGRRQSRPAGRRSGGPTAPASPPAPGYAGERRPARSRAAARPVAGKAPRPRPRCARRARTRVERRGPAPPATRPPGWRRAAQRRRCPPTAAATAPTSTGAHPAVAAVSGWSPARPDAGNGRAGRPASAPRVPPARNCPGRAATGCRRAGRRPPRPAAAPRTEIHAVELIEAATHPPTHLRREPRLADAARPANGDQADGRRTQQPDDAGQVGVAAHERGNRRRQPRRSGGATAGRGPGRLGRTALQVADRADAHAGTRGQRLLRQATIQPQFDEQVGEAQRVLLHDRQTGAGHQLTVRKCIGSAPQPTAGSNALSGRPLGTTAAVRGWTLGVAVRGAGAVVAFQSSYLLGVRVRSRAAIALSR